MKDVENLKVPFYKNKKFYAKALTIGAAILSGGLVWYEGLAQIVIVAFGG